MSSPVPALPPRARLLHIGIPKTGTTALQQAAASQRPALLAHGVCYPGRTVNHREAVCALMGRQFGWAGAGDAVPDPRHWTRLVAELDDHPGHRGFVSHEFASESTLAQARRFADALGPEVHVVVTLRGFAHLLGSSWQQYVKAGRRKAFRPWLAEILADDPHTRAAANFYRRNDQGAVVTRWVEAVGPDGVTVIVADKIRPTLLTDAFEDLLGLPRGQLGLVEGSGYASNRALSWPEAELMRRLNRVARRPQLTWTDYDRLVRGGAVERLLENRQPGPAEPAVRLPTWAADKATARARGYAETIAASGCRVVGDLAVLAAPVDSGRLRPDPPVPMDAAVEVASGLLSAALGRGAFFAPEMPAGTPALRRVAATARGRRWLELTQRTAGASPLDLLVVAGAQAVRAVRSAAAHRLP